MVFDINTHIVAQGDYILYNDIDEILVNETNGFAANSGGELSSLDRFNL